MPFIKTLNKDVVCLGVENLRGGSPLQGRTKAWLRCGIISAAADGSLTEGCSDCLAYFTVFLLVIASVIPSAQATKLFPAFGLVTRIPLSG